MASGECDFVLCQAPLLKPWDFAAGLLLIREAGGHAAGLDGAACSGLTPASSILCAGTPRLWSELRDIAAEAG